MPDREKVIYGLCKAIGALRALKNKFPNTEEDVEPGIQACIEAKELLKEQKAVKPVFEQEEMRCGICGHEVIWQKMIGDNIWADEELDYCPHCGKLVKWE